MAKKTSKMRADHLLVAMGLAETRQRAKALIMEGIVYTPAGRLLKPGTLTAIDTPLEVKGKLPYASRGGVKLDGALDRFGLDVSAAVALDVGASTGGFTDCLLQRGARRVIALDVGHGQLDYRLRKDPRVLVLEGVNAHFPFSIPFAAAQPDDAGVPTLVESEVVEPESIDIATIDVSFISSTKVIANVARHLKDGGALIVLVKPQFEARRDEVGRRGVIRDPRVHARVLARVIVWAVDNGYRMWNLVPSPILGDAGNREFFLLLGKAAPG